MPTQVRSHPDRAVTPWLWGLLPDNEAVLSRWARDFHASASSPFSMLATPIGHDCAGAVRFAAPDAVDEFIGQPGDVTWLTDEEVADRLRELREDATAWLGREFTGPFSLAGAQTKTALLHEDGRWGVPSGSMATSHILKPAAAGLDDHDLNEHLCLDALAWNWLIAGSDAHANNYSLLLASGQVRLAPLYDVASALPYGTHEKKLRVAMKIGGDYGVFPRRNAWPQAAGDLGLDPERVAARVEELAVRAPDAVDLVAERVEHRPRSEEGVCGGPNRRLEAPAPLRRDSPPRAMSDTSSGVQLARGSDPAAGRPVTRRSRERWGRNRLFVRGARDHPRRVD